MFQEDERCAWFTYGLRRLPNRLNGFAKLESSVYTATDLLQLLRRHLHLKAKTEWICRAGPGSAHSPRPIQASGPAKRRREVAESNTNTIVLGVLRVRVPSRVAVCFNQHPGTRLMGDRVSTKYAHLTLYASHDNWSMNTAR